ncbi:hypothetical protein GCM10022199_14270 [Marihabitans asiaticum]|uniref:F-type H+-transporting ATPase subunit epsilon n=1 Tax=Marihabitans asiaticum TaxID=415218 RepID=A0A560W8E2_9MICO|nr:F0F1 ATP synthase subunit epsilon [Marihabitans asiaticum]TWD13878.1 F-type H+-transporting ATPase subunit epsilon [Marihabitans asiaticum]
MSALTVELVAADRRVWSGEASFVRARSAEGELGIMPGHTPMLGVVVEGDIVIKTEGGERTASVDGGFLSVDHDNVTIVAETVTEQG